MNRDRILNMAGLTLLIVCFLVALVRVATRSVQELDPDTVTIRFAHWQLESGIREAFDELARQYMEMHPGVRVLQVAVPERTYETWVTTQLVGETAPDLIQLGFGMTDDRLARFYVPFTEIVEEPNPYNEGTEFEGMPWRDTFIDGLTSTGLVYNDNLLEIYGIPSSMFTVRIYYNRDLFREIFGHENTPETYEEFIELCRAVQAYSESASRTVIPVSGSRYNAPQLMTNLHRSQLQRYSVERSPLRNMDVGTEDFSIAYLEGEIRLDESPIREGFKLMREVGRFMQPGFLQLAREDAAFYFVQGRALMITTGSWDASSLMFQADFDIGAFSIPLPSPDHPVFGPNVMGVRSEASTGTGAAFGLTRYSRNRERVIDFLHFITSRDGNETFAQVSKWLPAVSGVEPAEIMRPFMPVTEGYPPGTNIRDSGADVQRVLDNNTFILVNPANPIDDFFNAIRNDYRSALLSDLRRNHRNRLTNIQRQDSLQPAYRWLGRHLPDEEMRDIQTAKASELAENQFQQEISHLWLQHEMARLSIPFNP